MGEISKGPPKNSESKIKWYFDMFAKDKVNGLTYTEWMTAHMVEG